MLKRLFSLRNLLNNKDFVYAVTLFAIIGTISFLFYEISKAEVTVVQEGEATTVRTHANTVEEVLKQLNIHVAEHDKLSHKLNDIVSSEMKIEHTVADQVIVRQNGEEKVYYTTADRVEDFVGEVDLNLREHDQLSVAMDNKIKDGMIVDILKAFQVTINDAGQKEKVWTIGATVEELLAKTDTTLSELDRVEPKQSAKIKDASVINITRVEKVTDVVEEPKEFATVKQSDASLTKGTEEVVSEGENGVIAKHYEVVLENGEEVSRELIKEEVKKESQDKVVAVGTKEVQETQQPTPSSTDTKTVATAEKNTVRTTVSRGSESSSKTIYMHATAYNWDCPSCDGRGLTSTGYDLKANPNGVVAVDPSVIPLGTKVW